MIVGILACAVLVGLTSGAVTYLFTGNPWLALIAYAASGSLTLIWVALARAACGVARERMIRSIVSIRPSQSKGHDRPQLASVVATGDDDTQDKTDGPREDGSSAMPVRPRRVEPLRPPVRARPERRNVVEFRTSRRSLAFA